MGLSVGGRCAAALLLASLHWPAVCPCSREVETVFAREPRAFYPLVIAVFSGEDEAGYKTRLMRDYSFPARRKGVRRSWLMAAQSANVPAFFVLSSFRLTESDRAEATKQRDVAILSDPTGQAWSYQGLSAKTLLLMHYMAGQCLAFKFLLKTDDDTFVHVPRLLQFVAAAPSARCMAGYLNRNVAVRQEGQWGNAQYTRHTALTTYPRFLQGGGYLLTSDVVLALAALDAAVPLMRWGSTEDMALGTWTLGWNLTVVPLSRRHVFLTLRQEDGLDQLRSRLCPDRWLLVHHVHCDTFAAFRDRLCGQNPLP